MLSCELFELVSQRGEAAGLDLDQQAAADKIDDETVDDPFDAIAGALVPVLELSVQRTLVERPDRRDLTFFGSDDLKDGAHDDPPSAPRRSCLRPGYRPAGAATTHNGRRTTTYPRKTGLVFALSSASGQSRRWLSWNSRNGYE